MRYFLYLALFFASLNASAQSGQITVDRAKAELCTPTFCAPVLIGAHLRTGLFPIQHARVLAPGYGGDVLAFDTRVDGVPLAIHRVWTLKPEQRRIERLQGPLAGRLGITGGCINVMPDVYARLVDCCSKGMVVILN